MTTPASARAADGSPPPTPPPSSPPEARTAPVAARSFGALVQAYWKPVYKYVRIRWRKGNEEAKDLTQVFEGTPAELVKAKRSPTGQYLRGVRD